MIYPENKAGEFRCCGPEGCGVSYQKREPYDPATGGVADRDTGYTALSPISRFCIGAKCAAWTWADAEIENRYAFTATESEALSPPPGDGWEIRTPPKYVGTSNFWSTEWQRKTTDRRGYCGLTHR